MYVCVLFQLFHPIYKNTNTFEHTSNVNSKSPSLLETFVAWKGESLEQQTAPAADTAGSDALTTKSESDHASSGANYRDTSMITNGANSSSPSSSWGQGGHGGLIAAVATVMLAMLVYVRNYKKHKLLTITINNRYRYFKGSDTSVDCSLCLFSSSLNVAHPSTHTQSPIHSPAQPHPPTVGCRQIREELLEADANEVLMMLMRYPQPDDVTALLKLAVMIKRWLQYIFRYDVK